MIDRQRDTIIFECDRCAEIFDAERDEFNEAWTAAKHEGWTARKIGPDWVHACPRCGR